MVILFTRGWKEDYIVNGLDELKLDDTANTQRWELILTKHLYKISTHTHTIKGLSPVHTTQELSEEGHRTSEDGKTYAHPAICGLRKWVYM